MNEKPFAGPATAPSTIGGRYVPHRRLWADGAGAVSVLSATDTWLERPVVVAVVDGSSGVATAAFAERARAWGRLYQPGLMELRDLVTWKGSPFAVWDDPGTPTLAGLVAERALSPGRVERLVAEMSAALDVLVEEGIVHGRLHPGAVAVDEDGGLRILPWPAAAVPSGYGGETAWQAPEVLAGAEPTHLSDRWSMGAIGLSALVGSGPGPLDAAETERLSDLLRRRATADLVGVLTTYMAAEPERRRLDPAGALPWQRSSPVHAAVQTGVAAATARPAAWARRVAAASTRSRRLVPPGRPSRWIWPGVAGATVAGVVLSVLPGAAPAPAGAAPCQACQPRQVVLAPPAPEHGSAAPLDLSEAAAVATPPTPTRAPAPAAPPTAPAPPVAHPVMRPAPSPAGPGPAPLASPRPPAPAAPSGNPAAYPDSHHSLRPTGPRPGPEAGYSRGRD